MEEEPRSGELTLGDRAVLRNNNGSGGVYVAYGNFAMTGGEIAGNTAGNGGGVYVYGGAPYDSTFTKTGGTVYGDDDNIHTPGSAENTAASGGGHAVYYFDGSASYYRAATLGEDDDISTNPLSTGWGQ
ncbi:MAG: hypothetical protein LBQ55_00215 [Treponema sp.]|jgi:hypothetical protein|nr:hypothetical protein [Treponema sp.]